MPSAAPRDSRPSARQRGYTTQWDKARAGFLAKHPQCAWDGCAAAATVVDHIAPHRGDKALFWDRDNWQPLCAHHHNSAKQRAERTGLDVGAVAPTAVDAEGRALASWEVRTASGRVWGYSIPHGVRPSAIPVMLVCGAPGSGKAEFVSQHAKRGDTVIDFNDILVRVGGVKHDADTSTVRRAFAYRDKMIKGLADKTAGRAWLIVNAATRAEREAWRAALGDVTINIMSTNQAECLRRIHADPLRMHTLYDQRKAVDHWFSVS